MDKSPFDSLSSEVVTYITVWVLSVWGGLVSFFNKMQTFTWRRLAAHISSAAFAGTMTMLLCQSTGITGPLVGALSGVAAHMGTPALIDLIMKSKFAKQLLGEEKK